MHSQGERRLRPTWRMSWTPYLRGRLCTPNPMIRNGRWSALTRPSSQSCWARTLAKSRWSSALMKPWNAVGGQRLEGRGQGTGTPWLGLRQPHGGLAKPAVCVGSALMQLTSPIPWAQLAGLCRPTALAPGRSGWYLDSGEDTHRNVPDEPVQPSSDCAAADCPWEPQLLEFHYTPKHGSWLNMARSLFSRSPSSPRLPGCGSPMRACPAAGPTGTGPGARTERRLATLHQLAVQHPATPWTSFTAPYDKPSSPPSPVDETTQLSLRLLIGDEYR